jgi:hypothetical protein
MNKTGVFKNYRLKIQRSLKGRGLLGSFLFIVRKYYLRFQYRKFDFNGIIETHKLDGPEVLRMHAVKYDPSNPDIFKKLFENTGWHFENSVFVDYGCGKGTAMVYASEMGFRKLIGIDFSRKLSEIAISNLKKYASMTSREIDYEVVCKDAREYEIPADADCFYFFNPFDSFIMDHVMQNLVKSLEKNPRNILIVYSNAMYKEIIEKYGFKKLKNLSQEQLDLNYFGGGVVFCNY